MTHLADRLLKGGLRLARIPVVGQLSTPSLRTVAQALARHGLRSLVAKIVSDLRSGGPALLFHKFRVQRALLPLRGVHSDAARSCGPEPTMPWLAPVQDNGDYLLDANRSLSLAQFGHFMSRWHKHPAITFLTADCGRRKFHYTIVVTPHSEHGLDKLADTLRLAHHLARRSELPIRVIVFAPEKHAPPDMQSFEPRDAFEVVMARSGAEIRKQLMFGSDCRHMVQFLVSGDRICPVLAEILARSKLSDFDLILTDMYLQEDANSVQLVLLPGVNPIHALNVDYFLSRAIMRADLAVEALDDVSSFDCYALTVAALGRCRACGAAAKVHHIAFPLLCISETQDSIMRRRLAVFRRESPLRLTLEPTVKQTGYRSPPGRVSVVICTKDNGFLLEQLVENLWRSHARELADIVVASNRTINPYALAVHERLAAGGRIKLVKYDGPFSFSAQSNLGAAVAGGEVLLFLNDDIVPVNSDWLCEIIAPLEEPSIGVVGPLLLYPDQSVQHAGMFLGFNNVSGHTLRGAHLPHGDYCFMASAPRQVMAVTGAAMCMRRADFETLNGFDGNLFALYIQDVDLCLRAHFSGLAVVYNPRAILLHMESVSVKATLADPCMAQRRAREHAAFLRRWGDVLAKDEFHNPNFSLAAEDLRRLVSPPS